MNKRKYRLIIADDHPAMRESIFQAAADMAPARLEVVAQAGDGLAVLELVKKLQPDIVLLDISLPKLDGISAAREIKKIRPASLVVIFSMYDDQAHVVEAVRAGADDYLFKHKSTPAEVVDHMLKALENKLIVQDTLHQRLFTALRHMEPEDLGAGVVQLTPAELAVLKDAAHHGHSMKEIAVRLSRPDKPLSELTVKKHFEHIYGKLGARSQAHAVCLAIHRGLISSDGAEPAG